MRGILDANGKVGLGVDGSSSNETVNLMDDCRIATYLQRSGGNPKGALAASVDVQMQAVCALPSSSSLTACGSFQQGVLEFDWGSYSSGYVHTDCVCAQSDSALTTLIPHLKGGKGEGAPGELE